MDEEQLNLLYDRLSLAKGYQQGIPVQFSFENGEDFGQDFEGFKNLMENGESDRAIQAIRNVYDIVSSPYDNLEAAYSGSFDK